MDISMNIDNFMNLQYHDSNIMKPEDFMPPGLFSTPLDNYMNFYQQQKFINTTSLMPESSMYAKAPQINTPISFPIKSELTGVYDYQNNNEIQQPANLFTGCKVEYQEPFQIKTENIVDNTLPLICKYCGQSYEDEKLLENHESTHLAPIFDDNKKNTTKATSKKPDKCYNSTALPYPANSAANTDVSIDGKPFKCSFCGKPFKRKRDMTNHERIHTGEKPYKCLYCTKAFSQIGAKNRHEHTHTGQKPYQCRYDSCDKTFKRRSDMLCHERSHTGDKPFKCSFCDKTFAQSGAKYNHERVHIGEGINNGESRLVQDEHIQR